MNYTTTSRNRQQGAALVIGMILLLVLTVLAISGMNSASTELIMAGNEQYRQNAFQAAETGLEQGVAALPTVAPTGTAATVSSTAISGSTTDDAYSTRTEFRGEDMNVSGFSAGKYAGYHFEISSTGTSLTGSSRQASARNTQGAYVIQSTGGMNTYGP